MISKKLLEILRCPACKEPVVHDPRQDTLTCTKCRRVFPIRNDIPVMLVDEKQ